MKKEMDYKVIANNLKDMLDSGKSISEILRMGNLKKHRICEKENIHINEMTSNEDLKKIEVFKKNKNSIKQ